MPEGLSLCHRVGRNSALLVMSPEPSSGPHCPGGANVYGCGARVGLSRQHDQPCSQRASGADAARHAGYGGILRAHRRAGRGRDACSGGARDPCRTDRAGASLCPAGRSRPCKGPCRTRHRDFTARGGQSPGAGRYSAGSGKTKEKDIERDINQFRNGQGLPIRQGGPGRASVRRHVHRGGGALACVASPSC